MRKLLMIALNTVALLGMASMLSPPTSLIPLPWVTPAWPPLSASASPLSVAVSVWVWA